MSALPQEPLSMSESQYLDFERGSVMKHEYLEGDVYTMTGAGWEHNLIAMNIGTSLNNQFIEKDYAVVSTDMRLKVLATGLYTYPDVMVVCGEPIFSDDHLDTVTNPIILIEVLSPSTERYDRGTKFHHYKEIESLQEYLLISQDSPRIERFLKEDTRWIYSEIKDLSATLDLPSIECSLRLVDVYRKVSFPQAKQDS